MRVDRDKFNHLLALMLEHMKSQVGANIFEAPMPSDVYPQYYDLVFHPMDMNKIAKRIEKVKALFIFVCEYDQQHCRSSTITRVTSLPTASGCITMQ